MSWTELFSTSKFPVDVRGYGPASNIWFLGPTRVHSLNIILIGSAVFFRVEGRYRQVDRHTTPSVAIDRIAAMLPKTQPSLWSMKMLLMQAMPC